MKIEVFSSYTDVELYEKIRSLRLEMFNYSVNRRFASKSDLGKIKFMRKSVARSFTVLNQRKNI